MFSHMQYELDAIDSSQGLSMHSAWEILNRLASFTDVLDLASSVNLAEIENEKNIANGGVLRQCLRLGKVILPKRQGSQIPEI